MLASAAIVSALAIGLGASVRGEEPSRAPLYYQDPDAKPFYSAGPKKTASGRDYLPVFEDTPAPAPTASAEPTSNVPAAKPAGGDRRVLYYRNPMGLPDTSPKPKNDSMGMAYIPVYADEGANGDPPGTVRISPGKIQTLGVRTETAEMRPSIDRDVRATGIVQFDERHLATVTTKVAGWIEHLAVSAVGDPVRRGQVLAEIYAPDLVASEEEYLVAARLGGAMAAASTQRLRAQDVPETEIARLRRTGRSSRLIAVSAPADGVVIEKPAQEGMRIGPGDALYKTADLSTVWLIAQVQEQDLGAIQPGQVAKANFVAFPGRTFEGKVDFIYPTLSADTRTARVRIVIPNPDGALRAAMYANVQIEAAAGTASVLAVPSSAVIDNGVRQVVLIDRGEGRFEPRRVQLGTHGTDWVQVTDGLKVGEKVVVGANFLIDAESNLRAALQGFTAGADDKPQATQPGATP
jgi:Cu(I)/Ag(I) efflux system membrane fusion protein